MPTEMVRDTQKPYTPFMHDNPHAVGPPLRIKRADKVGMGQANMLCLYKVKMHILPLAQRICGPLRMHRLGYTTIAEQEKG